MFSYSQFQEEYTLDQIMNSPTIFDPLTKLQCCPTSDGSAAAILATEDFVRAHGLENQAVEILGIEMATDLPSTFKERSCIKIVSRNKTVTIYIYMSKTNNCITFMLKYYNTYILKILNSQMLSPTLSTTILNGISTCTSIPTVSQHQHSITKLCFPDPYFPFHP